LKTLYLLRHAKSDWSDPRLADHDRPLAPRGDKAAHRMAVFLAEVRPEPQLVLCSSAVRARQTWAAVAEVLAKQPDVTVEPDLYGATASELLARIRRIPEQVDAVLMVGHNPGMEDLVAELAGDGDPPARQQLDTKFPTGALAILIADGGWKEVGQGSCYLESVVTPKRNSR
jgi:phosphohistidine phosphatase